MTNDEIRELERSIDEITEIAKGFGLDFYPMRYEICPSDIIYTFGAYGMPTRFSHWSFGKTFHKMKTQYDLGLSKIYELVINSNPCYAFLLDGNSLIQNKLIVAHVLAHCDFFKNNARFSNTNRNMVESMSATAERISQYEMEYGTEAIEQFLDAILAIQEHVDPTLIKPSNREYGASRFAKETVRGVGSTSKDGPNGRRVGGGATFGHGAGTNAGRPASLSMPKTTYDDLWSLDEEYRNAEQAEVKAREATARRFPPHPEKDLLYFLEEHSPVLEDWQRDILTMMRDEMLYFWPQIETKIMNEGWASYWHQRIVRELDLTPEETIEYAMLNSGVVQPSRHSLNPYYLGIKIFEDIEKRWDREKMFEVREFESDSSFVRNYMTKELVEDLDLYVFEKKGQEWKVTDKAWENIRDQLVYSRVNGGFPVLHVMDGNHANIGELYLKHSFEGVELDLKYLEKTLPYVQRLWGKTVHLETVVEDKSVLFTYDGKKHARKFL
ncbi:SpoVR family protein [Paenibacillus koleovorans]|uniref:SpoVR family protein n=1 Tax=Paenibacillus koleovorans TaxID=121608 RepID=UPI000FDCA481|nr:SpoVR family protein [Paenibacillus koleovorans]